MVAERGFDFIVVATCIDSSFRVRLEGLPWSSGADVSLFAFLKAAATASGPVNRPPPSSSSMISSSPSASASVPSSSLGTRDFAERRVNRLSDNEATLAALPLDFVSALTRLYVLRVFFLGAMIAEIDGAGPWDLVLLAGGGPGSETRTIFRLGLRSIAVIDLGSFSRAPLRFFHTLPDPS